MDASGNVYVTGYSGGDGTEYDYATVKYDAAGSELWTARYNGPANSSDKPVALVLDASGNVYVTGSSGTEGPFEAAGIKYNPDGNELWGRPVFPCRP